MRSVALGFSGGVDSAVSAVLLKRAGYDVHGVYLDNTDENAKNEALAGAEAVGIPLEVRDVHEQLEEKVCKKFELAYLNGETPNPCILCNPSLKFKNLMDTGYDFIATGHYAKSENGALYKGHPDNDQSYMLCRLTRPQLNRLLLPLGAFSKTEVRSLASEFGLKVATKPDSMEICFIPDKNYIGWLESRRPELRSTLCGDFVFHGEVIGQHDGIYRWTVGQRLPGLIDGRKVYISKIDAAGARIELALWEELFKTKVCARDFNWLCDMPDTFEASVRVRHTKWENPPCTVYKDGNGVRIECHEPVRAPAAGQSAVVYRDDRVIGAGFITGE